MKSLASIVLVWVILLVGAGCAARSPVRAIPARSDLPPTTQRVVVPMGLSRLGLPKLSVTVNDRPTELVIDTGAHATLISPQLAEQTGVVPRKTKMRSIDGGGNVHMPRGIGRLGAIKLGDAAFVDVEALVLDVSVLSASGESIGGAIAPPLFQDVLFTLDYPNKQVIVERGSLPEPNGHDVLPLRVGPMGKPMVQMSIGQRRLWVLIDSGFRYGMALPASARTQYPGADKTYPGWPYAYYYGVGAADRARLSDDLTIGWHVIRQPIVDIGVGRDPLMGGDYLRHFAITFDQRNGRVRFTRNEVAPIRVPPIYGPGYFVEHRTGRVVAVLPGSGAAKAGLRVGDRLTSVDGMAYARFRDTREHIVLQENTVSLIYEREGRLYPLVVPITVLLP